MNAHAHLLSLGWAGPGHALDSRPDDHLPTYKQKGHRGLAYDPAKVGNTGTGLVKPLSISQRKSRFGIGKKAHEPASGNQWWLKGFESALGNIGKSESERESSGTNTPLEGNAAVRFGNAGGKHAGLYGFFVKGQLMEGTILDSDQVSQGGEESRGKKRKSDVLDDEETTGQSSLSSSSSEVKDPKKQKKDMKAAKEFETVASFLVESHKDERRRVRKEKASDVEQFAQVGQFLEFKDGIDKKKSKKRKSETSPNSEDDVETRGDGTETKEERRERRRRRKEEKAKKLVATGIDGTIQLGNQIDGSDSIDAVAKAAQKTERKRRKAQERAKVSSALAAVV